jgi:hypothetical protein
LHVLAGKGVTKSTKVSHDTEDDSGKEEGEADEDEPSSEESDDDE